MNRSIILCGGCFWCLEAVFKDVIGVTNVVSGYCGGSTENPMYEQVCAGNTGHAECVKIDFEDEKVGLSDLLEVFWDIHDPTTIDRQGNDVGTQYRSAIFYFDDEQLGKIKHSIEELKKSKKYSGNVVTEIRKYADFYPAEAYHKDYYFNNPNNGYCRIVITPKVKKLLDHHPKLVKN